MSVWLKRQEAQAYQVRILAQGLSDIALSLEGGKTNVPEIFKDYLSALFPFQKVDQDAKDAVMKEAMKKEVKKGMLTFKPMAMDVLKKKAKTMELPDDFKQKLASKRSAK